MRNAPRWAGVAAAVVGAGCVARGEAGEPPEAFGGNPHVPLLCLERCGEAGCEGSGQAWASAGSCDRRQFRFSFTE